MTSREFRFDLGTVCLNFIATVGGRKSEAPVERMPTAERAMAWVGESGLLDQGDKLAAFNEDDLRGLVGLRELLHRLVHDLVEGNNLRSPDIHKLNEMAREVPSESVKLARTGNSQEWTLASNRIMTARNIAALIVTDFIRLIGTDQKYLLKQCEGLSCDGVYMDTTRGFNRRWCSSSSCGNYARVSRYRQQNESH